MDANTVIALKVHHGNKTFELFNLHFIDLNLTAIPLHLEWGVPVRGSSRSSIKLLSELAHTQLNYLSPFRTANLVSVCLFPARAGGSHQEITNQDSCDVLSEETRCSASELLSAFYCE